MKGNTDLSGHLKSAASVNGLASLPQQPGSAPAVSIVTATYNRPAVLGFAIRSILKQDFADWELIVIGDRCTDATAELVASFADPRIRYINLVLNWGDQSGPDNVGIARATGRYIAFLNHDDFWFPDHLRAAIDWLEASGADGVLARSAVVVPAERPGDADSWRINLTGAGQAGRYDPVRTEGPISTLLLKSSAARAIRPLRSASECFASSSQEWLFRLWSSGFDIRTMPHLTVLQIPSGLRPRSYIRPDSAEHEFFEPQFEQPLQLRIALLDRFRAPPERPRWWKWTRSVARVALRAAAQFGWCPSELIAKFYLGFRRGRFIEGLRKSRGLTAFPLRDPTAAELRARYAAEQGQHQAKDGP